MIGSVFSKDGRTFTVSERATARSYSCAAEGGDSIILSTRAINKLMGKSKPAAPVGEDAAAIEIGGLLAQLDEISQIRVVQGLAQTYLNEKPTSTEASASEFG